MKITNIGDEEIQDKLFLGQLSQQMIEGKGTKRIPNFKFGLGAKLQYEYYEGQYYKFV